MLVKGDTLYSASANRVYKRKRKSTLKWDWLFISITGDPLHSRAACTQPCNVNTLIVLPEHVCVNNGCTPVSTMGHGCVQVPGCVEGHPCICLWYPVKHYRRSNIIDKPMSMTTIVPHHKRNRPTHPSALPSICPLHLCGFHIFPDKSLRGLILHLVVTFIMVLSRPNRLLIVLHWFPAPPVPGFWLVGQFSHIFRQTANRMEHKFGGATHMSYASSGLIKF